MPKNTRCGKCRFAEPCPNASERGWTAIVCMNRDSQFYKAVLNATMAGIPRAYITWKGCPLGERRITK